MKCLSLEAEYYCLNSTCYTLVTRVTLDTPKKGEGVNQVMHCPDWMKPAIQKRFDDLDLFVQKELQIQHDWEETDRCFERLKASLNPEQLDLLNQWDDHIQQHIAKEKEWLYRNGLADGIHVAASVLDIKSTIHSS